jgi:hypothetical protein
MKTRVLRKIFGPKKDEVIGGWRIFHGEFRVVFLARYYLG